MESINNINADLATFTSLVPARRHRARRSTVRITIELPTRNDPIWSQLGHDGIAELYKELDANCR